VDTVTPSPEQRKLQKFFLKGKAGDFVQAQTLALFTLDDVRAFNLAVMAEIYNRSQNRHCYHPHQPNDFIPLLAKAEVLCAKREETAKMLWVAPFVAAATDLTVHRYYGGGFGFSFDCDGLRDNSSGAEPPFSRLCMNIYDDKARKPSARERTLSFAVKLEHAEFLLHSDRRIRFPEEAVELERKEREKPTLFSLIETGYQPSPPPPVARRGSRTASGSGQLTLPITMSQMDLGFRPR